MMQENIKIIDHDTYISAQLPAARKVLKSMRALINKAIPDAEEVFSYQMPGFKLNGMVCWYAAFKEHMSLFIPPGYQIPFKEDLKKFDCSKAGIRIPYGDPIPEKLFTAMVKFAAESVRNKGTKKKKTKDQVKSNGKKTTTNQAKSNSKKKTTDKKKSIPKKTVAAKRK
ncbi:MAG: iron chaperone [Chitinophagaceae bacterium]